jgi:hypothetical protein
MKYMYAVYATLSVERGPHIWHVHLFLYPPRLATGTCSCLVSGMSSRASISQKKRRREERESTSRTPSVDLLSDAALPGKDRDSDSERDQLISSPPPTKPKKNSTAKKTSGPNTKKAPQKKKCVSGKAANAASTQVASDDDSEISKKATRAYGLFL